MRMDQDDHPPIPAGWNTHITVLRRRELIDQLYQQVNHVDKNKCTHVHIFFTMFYLVSLFKEPEIADEFGSFEPEHAALPEVRQQPHQQTDLSPPVSVGRAQIIPSHDGPKRKLVMAGEAPMLVQQVLLPQMRLLVLLVPQVRLLVPVLSHVQPFSL